ncbi:MAG: aminoacyl-tRNA hydrolase [Clostridia bacterium]|nr:aminoacyl-tRNA hydrolase [Clostridia bacterium]
MKVLIGLGNPGAEYARSRHNCGFSVIDCLSRRWNLPVDRAKCRGLAGEGRYGGERVILLKPQTYMNLSGDCVADALRWYKVGPQDVMIFSDDIDLPLGTIRVRPFGGAGTHNGWRDILLKTGSDRFPRVRVGVGAKPPEWDLADWVLSRFSPDDQKLMDAAFARAADAAKCFLSHGIEEAMNVFNRKA